MVRAFAYGTAGGFIGVVLSVFGIVIVPQFAVACLFLGVIIGIALGVLLAMHVTRKGYMKEPFLNKKSIDTITFVADMDLRGNMPERMRMGLVGKLRDYLESKISR